MEPDSSHLNLDSNPQGYLVNLEQIYDIASKVQRLLGVEDHEISIDFVSPEAIRSLNQSYREKSRSTDVLSFPQQDWESPLTLQHPNAGNHSNGIPQLLGDIVISLDDASNNAKEIGQELDREVCFLLIHGILHLCGHDHINTDEEKVMLEQQRLILAELQRSEPPPAWESCVRSKS